jgi:multiple sugar transport system substrate-binding protein
MNRYYRFAYGLIHVAIITLALGSCAQLNIPGLTTDPAATETQPVVSPTVPVQPTASPEDSTPTETSTVTLRVWLPPEFDPNEGSEAGKILQDRLDEFQNRRPNLKIEIRLKAVDGTGGMINTLTTASAAATLALPDMVALPRQSIEPAVQKGLIYPLEDLGNLSQASWYPYAAEFSFVNQGQFSLPFAGDALVLHYRPELIENPPETWDDSLLIQYPLLFPAADPQALFTLAQYQASGGTTIDSDGRPSLQQTPLTGVYIFYQRASSGEQMPFWLTQYEDDDQVWQAYQDGTAPMAVSWFSKYLTETTDSSAIGQLPTSNGSPFTLATGWAWAITNPDPQRRQVATELAVFLSDTDFLSSWTLATGYLPTRPDILDQWDNIPAPALAEQVILSAFTIPPVDILNILGPALQESTITVLKQQNTPSAAAEEAVQNVNSP